MIKYVGIRLELSTLERMVYKLQHIHNYNVVHVVEKFLMDRYNM